MPIAVEQIGAERLQQLEDDLGELLRTQWGRRLLHWLVYDVGELEANSFRSAPAGHEVAGIRDGEAAHLHHAFHSGRRAMAGELLEAARQVDFDAVQLMRIEDAQAMAADHARTIAEGNGPEAELEDEAPEVEPLDHGEVR